MFERRKIETKPSKCIDLHLVKALQFIWFDVLRLELLHFLGVFVVVVELTQARTNTTHTRMYNIIKRNYKIRAKVKSCISCCTKNFKHTEKLCVYMEIDAQTHTCDGLGTMMMMMMISSLSAFFSLFSFFWPCACMSACLCDGFEANRDRKPKRMYVLVFGTYIVVVEHGYSLTHLLLCTSLSLTQFSYRPLK